MYDFTCGKINHSFLTQEKLVSGFERCKKRFVNHETESLKGIPRSKINLYKNESDQKELKKRRMMLFISSKKLQRFLSYEHLKIAKNSDFRSNEISFLHLGRPSNYDITTDLLPNLTVLSLYNFIFSRYIELKFGTRIDGIERNISQF